MVLILKKFLYRSKSCCTWAISLYSGENGCNQAKVVVFGKKWFFSCKSGSIREKNVVFGESCSVRTKVVLIGQKLL